MLHISPTFFRTALLLSLLILSACSQDKPPAKQVPFDAVAWREQDSSSAHPHRRSMVQSVLSDTRWIGRPKDSVIAVLGLPDSEEEGNLRYDYAHSSFLGGMGTKIDAVVFELGRDSCVRKVRENGGGFD